MFNEFFDTLRKLIFPNHCIVCNMLCLDKYFCDSCKDTLNPFSVKLCTKCGAPLKFCECKFHFHYFDGISTVFENDGIEKESFYKYKFGGNAISAEYFANKLADSVVEKFGDISFDTVTYVPMHWQKRFSNGYNHSEMLARKVAKRLSATCRPLLYQPKKSKIQHTLSINERFLSVKNKYKLKKRIDIKGNNILLVDDIMTTGATLSECSRLLKLGGAEKVYAAAVLKTIRKKENSAK